MLAALACWLPTGEVAARCLGSTDPVVQSVEVAIGRDPGSAIDTISGLIARMDPENARRIAELYAAQLIAISMSGQSREEIREKAHRAASRFGPADNINLFLRINDYAKMKPGPARADTLAAIVRDYGGLPEGSQARTCRGTDLAHYHSVLNEQREAFGFASSAYRNSEAHENSSPRAEAASMMSYLVSLGYDFEYAGQLSSEALEIWLGLGMSDLAANELVLRGYMHLSDGGWQPAIADFRASAEQARSYGNQYAIDYALLGVCEAALKGEKLQQAAPACTQSFGALAKPREPMAFLATTLMAELLVSQGEPNRALRLIEPWIAGGRGDASFSEWARTLAVKAQALSLLGRYREAYPVMRQAKSIADEGRENELRSGSAALRARFKTQELQDSLAQQERTSGIRLRLAAVVMVAAAAIITLLGALIYSLLRHRRRFRRLAMTDPLTGLRNRRAAQEEITSFLRTPATETPRASFALLDIDHFKSCNDRFGHDAGDIVLNRFARVIERCVRPGDIVGRWGGEEFLLIAPATDVEETARIVERIRAEAERETFDAAPGFRLHFSAGIAQLGEGKDRIHECIKLADRRLYGAKASGRNTSCAAGYDVDPEL